VVDERDAAGLCVRGLMRRTTLDSDHVVYTLALVPQSLFARVTRYPRSSLIDPHENRLTEVTASVFERVDGLAHQAIIDLLKNAAAAADDAARLAGSVDAELQRMWRAEAARLHETLDAARKLSQPRVRVRTQIATPKGGFVDLEVWLRPEKPADPAPDVLVWVESKHGSDIHDTQLDIYLQDIDAQPAVHKVVLLPVPPRPNAHDPVPRVRSTGRLGGSLEHNRRAAPVPRTGTKPGLAAHRIRRLPERGGPNGPGRTHCRACPRAHGNGRRRCCHRRHLRARRGMGSKELGDPKNWKQVRGASTDHGFGCEYWASYRPHKGEIDKQAPTWLSGWFDSGVGYTSGWQYLDAGTVRGSVAFWAGAGFETKANRRR
jgi:hypothetical protein